MAKRKKLLTQFIAEDSSKVTTAIVRATATTIKEGDTIATTTTKVNAQRKRKRRRERSTNNTIDDIDVNVDNNNNNNNEAKQKNSFSVTMESIMNTINVGN
mmetsp:Transcript_9370/g.9141  ORF Transcript_9370/g.9141 Transcript_9370/m.9141 type:complete len:101 (-) Transcript_9370:1786-2088(-)